MKAGWADESVVDDALAAACRALADRRAPRLDANARDRAIRASVDAGMARLERPSARLRAAFRALAPGLLFAGVGDAVACAFIGAVLVFACVASAASVTGALPVAAFTGAPALYALLLVLTTGKGAGGELAAWRRTCRITAYELGALRMLAFGLISLVSVVPATALLWLACSRLLSFTWLLSVACAGLCVFAALSLACLLAADGRGLAAHVAGLAVPVLIWCGGGVLLARWEQGSAVVMAAPAAVFAVVAVFAAGCYAIELRALVRRGCGGAGRTTFAA